MNLNLFNHYLLATFWKIQTKLYCEINAAKRQSYIQKCFMIFYYPPPPPHTHTLQCRLYRVNSVTQYDKSELYSDVDCSERLKCCYDAEYELCNFTVRGAIGRIPRMLALLFFLYWLFLACFLWKKIQGFCFASRFSTIQIAINIEPIVH